MGILGRFKDIMASNINALLDKAEDPEKMVDQVIRNLEEELEEAKKETVSIMADEKAAKRDLDQNNDAIAKMDALARKAVEAGNDDDARKFLTEKASLSQKNALLQKNYDLTHSNSEKMKQMYEKLTNDLASAKDRRDLIKSKVKIAKTQEHMTKLSHGSFDSSASMAAFDRLDDKADAMLDQAEADEELTNVGAGSDVKDLAEKYDTPSSSVEDELAALKASMGK
ncbi:MAG: PspA/IM30 family protein [Lachnospiraceae bacterium]|nr:PspA/IM30 family protein [Lachnospiraceae bacterium]MEE3460857.1 PspA/IM30 family protein [Lachnospiraceae bacterium]